MVKRKEQQRMMDFLVASLEGSSQSITPAFDQPIGGVQADYIQVGKEGAVLLVDKVFPGDSFRRVCLGAQSQFGPNLALVFYKDGKTFFRSSAQDNYYKKDKDLSLKHYSTEDLQRMITTRPEEASLIERGRLIQYFQPESERLQEGVVSFKFKPVRFDYSHVNSSVRFKPENRDSSKMVIWTERREHGNSLRLNNSYLVNNPQLPQTPEGK